MNDSLGRRPVLDLPGRPLRSDLEVPLGGSYGEFRIGLSIGSVMPHPCVAPISGSLVSPPIAGDQAFKVASQHQRWHSRTDSATTFEAFSAPPRRARQIRGRRDPGVLPLPRRAVGSGR